MIPWYQKLGIGAVGAFCLSLLKLISANFYLGAIDRNVAIGAYLTYFAYLILGMAVGYFMSEQSTEADKTRKSAFLMGLLAPSILIAIVTKPIVTTPETGQASAVPTLHSRLETLFELRLLAQSPGTGKTQTLEASDRQPVTVQVLEKPDASASLWTGALSALGWNTVPASKYTYVVAKTDDEKLAMQKATDISAVLKKTNHAVATKVLKAESANQFFITIGDGATAADAAATKKSVTESAVAALMGPASASDRSTAQVMLGGQILSLATLRHGSLLQ